MKSSTKRPSKKQDSCLPLLNWPAVVVRPSTRAGQFLARRYYVHPAIADVVAEAAGLGGEVRS